MLRSTNGRRSLQGFVPGHRQLEQEVDLVPMRCAPLGRTAINPIGWMHRQGHLIRIRRSASDLERNTDRVPGTHDAAWICCRSPLRPRHCRASNRRTRMESCSNLGRSGTAPEKSGESRPQPFQIPRLAFPNYHRRPAQLSKVGHVPEVPGHIRAKLLLPEGLTCIWYRRASTSIVAVPETAMNEDHLLPAWEADVRRPGQIAPVEPVAVAEGIQQTSHGHFRPGVLRPDPCHVGTSFRRRSGVVQIHRLGLAPQLSHGGRHGRSP